MMASSNLNVSGTKWTSRGICLSLLIMSSHSFSLPPPNSPFHNFHDQNGENNDNHHWNLPGLLLYSTAVATATDSISISDSETEFEPTLYASASTSDNNLPPTPSATQIKQHTGNVLQSTLKFWNNKVQQFTKQKKKNQSNKNIQSQENEQEIEQLKQTKISKITAPKSTIFSTPLLQHAGQQARLIGNTLNTPGVQHLAKILTQHYHRMGYPLCSVTGATLTLDGECKIQTQEPRNFEEPVNIAFAKEMVVDNDGNTVSFRQYKEQLEAKQPSSLRKNLIQRSSSPSIQKKDLNTTYVQTSGKTRSDAIAKAIGLRKGEVFQWDPQKWKTVVQSGIWDKVISVEPVRLKDGSVQLRVICQESHRRHVEYGVTKSLYTGAWEGEMDFENRNLFGGGEVISVAVKRGARDPEPSVHLKYQDDKFGNPHGYSLEAFQDYIGPEKYSVDEKDQNELDASNPLLTRRGMTFRLSTPIPQSILQRSAASASLERTNTRKGETETIASTTVQLGPYARQSASNALRHSLLTSITTGTRLLHSSIMKPYTAGTILARQVIPLANGSNSLALQGATSSLSPLLAFRHSITTSSQNLPRHEANAAGVSSRVRGYSSGSNGPISSSLVGTTELRFPFRINKFKVGSGSLVFFADWLLAQPKTGFDTNSNSKSASFLPSEDVASSSPPPDELRGGGISSNSSSFIKKASVGVGLRKDLQGIPIKYDLSLTMDGKIGAFFGIGKDFDVL